MLTEVLQAEELPRGTGPYDPRSVRLTLACGHTIYRPAASWHGQRIRCFVCTAKRKVSEADKR